ncbi:MULTISPECIES: glutaredoxin family protein [Haloarcula]|uniref:Glutaredoxin n=1 Tax=Haloarcula pellucida TaxID=1427151 RepID=A0A830GQ72_9EURY|nr:MULTISPECIES: glutaredoxin domain-containing protein [Halomicroarcula]MBX0347898.1 glutaredoxin [Halomicroarcula pellucida]MDS0279973.1 glutaredoxin [Halomicroarcula sp. S1AR25-4]GGN95967.1 glutaredoxin [Halomicroarcula pellucida]
MSFEPEELSREEVQEKVDETIENNEVALFMKGNEMMPQCGYSRKAIGLIKQYREDVATVNVLTATEAYREALSEYSGRETIPQTFVDGEFVGGSDILEQLDENGDLEATLNA